MSQFFSRFYLKQSKVIIVEDSREGEQIHALAVHLLTFWRNFGAFLSNVVGEPTVLQEDGIPDLQLDTQIEI